MGSDAPVTGYMVLNRDGAASWDGYVYSTFEVGAAELRQARSNPAKYGTGWYLALVRELPETAGPESGVAQ